MANKKRATLSISRALEDVAQARAALWTMCGAATARADGPARRADDFLRTLTGPRFETLMLLARIQENSKRDVGR